jgi:hypothetical protein
MKWQVLDLDVRRAQLKLAVLHATRRALECLQEARRCVHKAATIAQEVSKMPNGAKAQEREARINHYRRRVEEAVQCQHTPAGAKSTAGKPRAKSGNNR